MKIQLIKNKRAFLNDHKLEDNTKHITVPVKTIIAHKEVDSEIMLFISLPRSERLTEMLNLKNEFKILFIDGVFDLGVQIINEDKVKVTMICFLEDARHEEILGRDEFIKVFKNFWDEFDRYFIDQFEDKVSARKMLSDIEKEIKKASK